MVPLCATVCQISKNKGTHKIPEKFLGKFENPLDKHGSTRTHARGREQRATLASMSANLPVQRGLVSYWPKPKKTKNGQPIKPNFGPKFSRYAMPWFESYWHNNGRYPSDGEIMDRFGCSLDQVRQLNTHRFWLGALQRRGITPPGLGLEFELTDKQIAAISLITNFNILEPLPVKLASIGVTEEELDGWYKNPTFKDALRNRADTVLSNVSTDATVELARAIKKGNFAAIKFYFEITGQTQSQEAVDVKRAMQILIEAVQKHVKDDAVLEAIASEVQSQRAIQGL